MLVLLALLTARDYGRTVDVTTDLQYGHDAVHFYTSLGRDTGALGTPDLQETHGPLAHELLYLASHVVGPEIARRNLLIALMGIAGVTAIGLCGFALGRPWVGVGAAAILTLTPRWYGDMFTNGKDVPFAAASWLALWAGLMLMRDWPSRRWRWTLGLAAFVGAATAIRIGGLLAWPLLLAATVVALARLRRRGGDNAAVADQQGGGVTRTAEARRLVVSAAVVILGSLTLTVLVWPYLLVNPLGHLQRTLEVSSHFPWNGQIMFAGRLVPAVDESRWYAPVWLLIATPLPTLVLATLGVAAVVVHLVRGLRSVSVGAAGGGWLLVVAVALLPVAVAVATRTVLYDGMRHLLVVTGPIALLAAYGAAAALEQARDRQGVGVGHGPGVSVTGGPPAGRKLPFGGDRPKTGPQAVDPRDHARRPRPWLPTLLLLALLAAYTQVATEMTLLHPYEYTYFNQTVGSLPGAAPRYDTDYWGVCFRESALWLSAHRANLTPRPVRVQATMDAAQTFYYLDSTFLSVGADPDVYVTNYREARESAHPDYRPIFQVTREGVPLCEIKVRPGVMQQVQGSHASP